MIVCGRTVTAQQVIKIIKKEIVSSPCLFNQ